MKGQAMIIDALLFLMLCGMSAAVLAWASSVYGNQALEAYRYLYMIDVESSVVQTLGEASYLYHGNELFWLDQLGRYLEGQFNESDERFKLLLDEWNLACQVSGSPLLVEIYPEETTTVCVSDGKSKTCADRNHPIILACKIKRENEETSTLESVLNYTCNSASVLVCSGTKKCSKPYADLGSRYGNEYKHMMFLKLRSPNEADCRNQDLKPEPPYYASPRIGKLCHSGICNMYAKIYY